MNDPTVTNHTGILSTTHARKTGETPFTLLRNRSYSYKSQLKQPLILRNRSEHDPPMIRPHTKPARNRRHRRDRSSRFGGGLCMENMGFRTSAASQNAFCARHPLDPIGNSSTSICIAGTILQIQSTMECQRQRLHQHHLQSHVHFGNDPTVTNHTGILSTTHARKTGETPCIMRNRSDHDPPMIRTWSADDPTTYETVSQLSHRKGRSSKFGDALVYGKT